jgi:hypothetical protein
MTELSSIREVKPHSFIFEKDNALPDFLCDNMVERFEQASDEHYPGRIGQTFQQDQSIKKSTDMVVSGKKHWKDVDNNLFRSLGLALQEFKQGYEYFQGSFKDNGYAIQRTGVGEHYHWHIDGGSHDFSQRQLVALWYLNDVPGPGGETEFRFQDVKISPQKGKLILFPPFWTHEHRGVTLEKGIKYIATTWFVFA